MRVVLFSDTVADVNGVARFVRAAAARARASGRELTVVTCTRKPLAESAGVINLPAVWSRAIPGYENLDVAWPRRRAVMELVRRLRPDVVHVSTPGPVGLAGRAAARRMGVPLVGTYHTDFPAYAEHLYGDAALTWIAGAAMKWFYRPFARVMSRSAAYTERVGRLGRGGTVALRPGVDLEVFSPRWRDDGVWRRLGVRCGAESAVTVLYCGRVSVEKNLPMLAEVWPGVWAEAMRRGVESRLVVLGDGPYLAAMRRAMVGTGHAHESDESRRSINAGAWMPGFVQGKELSAAYASADLFVFPSTTDTLGQAVMEAQASGVAAVVSDRGGPSHIVRDGATGVVVSANGRGVHRAWRDAMVGLVCDAGRRGAMGKAAAKGMREYSFERSFEEFWRVHEEVVSGTK